MNGGAIRAMRISEHEDVAKGVPGSASRQWPVVSPCRDQAILVESVSPWWPAATQWARREVGMVKDPVCGMMIDEKAAAGQSEYQGQPYYFCAPVCKQKFDAAPSRYVDRDSR